MKGVLLVIDMANDFAPGGKLPVEEVGEIKDAVLREIGLANDREDKVIFVTDWHDSNDREFAVWYPHCMKGTSGAEVIKPLLQEAIEPYRVDKTTYDGFYSTNLNPLLTHLGASSLRVVGCVSHICILFTVASAVLRGYEVVVVKDAVAGLDEELTASAFKIMSDVLGVRVE